MADTTISPNMNLPIPTVSEAPGPGWATNNNACLLAIDGHNHTSGQGVPITPSGMDISSDLPMSSNNLTEVRSVNFTAQSAPIALATDLGCLYVSGSDLYYNDEAGNQVRITQSGTVTGSSGTITGLPSGTASASYSAGTFTFQGATSTPATMAVGPVVIGRAVASSKTVSLTPNSGQAANYGFTFPASLPASTSFVSVDTSGNLATVAATGTGSVVLATSPTIATPTLTTPTISSPAITGGTITSSTITTPTFSGVPAGTIISASFSPTVTWAKTAGTSLTITTNTSTWRYMRIGNVVTVVGKVLATITGFSATGTYTMSATIPVATASLVNAGQAFYTISGVGTAPVTLTDVSNTSILLSPPALAANGSITTGFTYSYVIS